MTKTNTCSINTQEKLDNLAFLRDSNKPTLENLSYALRHPETWPKGFVWNYHLCTSCAMGLARELWKEVIPEPKRGSGASIMAHAFAMPYEDANSIFMGQGPMANDWMPFKRQTTGALWWKKEAVTSDHESVTPEMVADQIDNYIKSNK